MYGASPSAAFIVISLLFVLAKIFFGIFLHNIRKAVFMQKKIRLPLKRFHRPKRNRQTYWVHFWFIATARLRCFERKPSLGDLIFVFLPKM